MTENKKFTGCISWLFLLYFVILFAERAQSLIRVIAGGQLFAAGFDTVVNMTVILSLCAAVMMLLLFNASFWRSLFAPVEPDYSILTITSGVMLVSGMVHTEYTIPGIQFAAYGMLIAAMVLRTAALSRSVGSRASLWYSLVYLTAFSMAIPVMYQLHTATQSARFEKAFYLVEADVMLLLVLTFTVMLRRLFIGKGENLLLWIPFLILVVGDTAVLWMRWTDEINFFVLIFAAVSAALFLVGKMIFRTKKDRR